METINVIRRATSWRDLEPGTVFMFNRDIVGAESSSEPWRYARMVVDLPTFSKGWVSFFTGYAFEVDLKSDECNECIVIAEPIG